MLVDSRTTVRISDFNIFPRPRSKTNKCIIILCTSVFAGLLRSATQHSRYRFHSQNFFSDFCIRKCKADSLIYRKSQSGIVKRCKCTSGTTLARKITRVKRQSLRLPANASSRPPGPRGVTVKSSGTVVPTYSVWTWLEDTSKESGRLAVSPSQKWLKWPIFTGSPDPTSTALPYHHVPSHIVLHQSLYCALR